MSADTPPVDASPSVALSRLTEREKDCLRRCLQHQTAKQMALDLGVSPHAIEKRLKMARTKLGVASSLAAARLLAAEEGYGQTGPRPPDLGAERADGNTAGGQPRKGFLALSGVLTMSVLAITLFLLLAPQAASPGDAGLAPRPGEVLVTTPESFDSLDQDGSGFLEGDEAPTTVRLGGEVTLTPDGDGHTAYSADYIQLSRDPWRDSFYAAADTDRDTRISRDEYARWARGAMAEPAAVQSPSQ